MDINDWLLNRIGTFPVLANTIAREAALRGWGEQEVREAFDATKLSYIKQGGGARRVAWYKPLWISHWIWCSFWPTRQDHRDWIVEILERKGYERMPHFHQKLCPPPMTFIERKTKFEWTEPSSFAHRSQNVVSPENLSREEAKMLIEVLFEEQA